MKKILSAFVAFCVLINFSIAFAVENEKRHWMYYWDKGNSGDPISMEEFNILIKQLENRMIKFQEAFSKIKIEDANFSYKNGKDWEIDLNLHKESLDFAFKMLAKVKANPNSMYDSLILFIVLNDILRYAYDLADIEIFDKHLDDTHHQLSFWLRAFQKAHLNMLAFAKDKNVKLY